jgi:hypothetical protein
MIFAYSLSNIKFEKIEKEKGIDNHGFKSLKEKIIKILNETGIAENNLVYGRILERLTQISGEDVNLLHSVCSKITEKINNEKD